MLNGLLTHNVEETSVKELNNNSSHILFLDAREPEEFAVSHIKNAINVGHNDIDLSLLDSLNYNREIVVYCSVGYRSEKVTKQIQKQGFNNVKNLVGGIFEWVNQGKPIYQKTLKTNKIHAYSKAWGIWLKKGDKLY